MESPIAFQLGYSSKAQYQMLLMQIKTNEYFHAWYSPRPQNSSEHLIPRYLCAPQKKGKYERKESSVQVMP